MPIAVISSSGGGGGGGVVVVWVDGWHACLDRHSGRSFLAEPPDQAAGDENDSQQASYDGGYDELEIITYRWRAVRSSGDTG